MTSKKKLKKKNKQLKEKVKLLEHELKMEIQTSQNLINVFGLRPNHGMKIDNKLIFPDYTLASQRNFFTQKEEIEPVEKTLPELINELILKGMRKPRNYTAVLLHSDFEEEMRSRLGVLFPNQ